MNKWLLFGDAHLETLREVDNSYLLFKEVIKAYRPNSLVIGGDLLDLSYISRFSEGAFGQQEGKRLTDDLSIMKDELKFFRKYVKGDIVYLEGNHEARIGKLMDKNPVLKGLISIQTTCEEMGIKFIPTECQPYKLFDDLYITHGLTYTKHFGAKLADTMGCNTIQFHTHRTQQFTNSYPDGRCITGYGVGSLTNITEYYEKGKRVTGHSNSFGELIEIDGTWQLNLIHMENDKCIINNKIYTLCKEEPAS